MLCSGGSDLESLQALAAVAKMEKKGEEDDEWEDVDDKAFNTKMNIVVRTDKAINDELSP